MFVKDRRSARNWAPGVFATFWILLAAFSAAYLFRVISEPIAAGSEAAQHGSDSSAAAATAAPASDEQSAELATASEARDRELAELKATLRDLTQQVTELKARLNPSEKMPGPVAAAEPVVAAEPPGAVTTSPPTPAPVLPADKPVEHSKAPDKPANGSKPAEAAKPAELAKAPDRPVETPKPAETPKPVETPKPAELAKAPDRPAETPKPSSAPSEEMPPAVAVSPVPDEKPAEKATAPVQVTSNEPTGAPSAGSPPATGAPSPAMTETANLSTAIPIPPGTTRFGIEIGSVDKQDALRPMWRDLLGNHAALVAGLQARRVLAPDKKWRLIAGPFGNADEAAQACGLFKKASLPCDPTVFAGDSL
jgi:hypothetical protein